ncbi:MAG: HEAT repeat domain-containing protein [Prochloraceae cyanobacterium]|nr:HEAT repeat domain-containing protein [Prochloraceae cyanobacterium]
MAFDSYFWTPSELPRSPRIDFMKFRLPNNSLEKKFKHFHNLLFSDSVIGRGIAFDQFSYSVEPQRLKVESYPWTYTIPEKLGAQSPYWKFSDELLVKAREELQKSPITSENLHAVTIKGANHASALLVLQHLASEEDVKLIVPIISSSKDTNVTYLSCKALKKCLYNSQNYYPEVLSILRNLIFNEQEDLENRQAAIQALETYNLPEVEELLIEISQKCPDLLSATV